MTCCSRANIARTPSSRRDTFVKMGGELEARGGSHGSEAKQPLTLVGSVGRKMRMTDRKESVAASGAPPASFTLVPKHLRIRSCRTGLKRRSTEKISQRLEGTETVLADRVTAEERLRARAPARPELRSS